jgi:hypothetical protein
MRWSWYMLVLPSCTGACNDLLPDHGAVYDPAIECESGLCKCVGEHVDCNGDPNDGCETNIFTEPRHCGDCNTDCLSGACIHGECAQATLYATATFLLGSFDLDSDRIYLSDSAQVAVQLKWNPPDPLPGNTLVGDGIDVAINGDTLFYSVSSHAESGEHRDVIFQSPRDDIGENQPVLVGEPHPNTETVEGLIFAGITPRYVYAYGRYGTRLFQVSREDKSVNELESKTLGGAVTRDETVYWLGSTGLYMLSDSAPGPAVLVPPGDLPGQPLLGIAVDATSVYYTSADGQDITVWGVDVATKERRQEAVFAGSFTGWPFTPIYSDGFFIYVAVDVDQKATIQRLPGPFFNPGEPRTVAETGLVANLVVDPDHDAIYWSSYVVNPGNELQGATLHRLVMANPDN